ncbi:hypothetical protein KGM_209493 [Danaus plexippus plexippus]|uniref:Uncharacterized protein n=1 Tax=Danaus plexippus plexippus TaxID=278856 RepID=A0A212ELB3_DANPL|nr:hypothetical protein KGM_209493 [Danaus plexippus plexippus]
MYDKYNFITGVPHWNEKKCDLDENVTMMNINSCVNGSLDKNDEKFIFPSKYLNNLKLCKLKIGMAPLFPYSVIANENSLQSLDRLKEEDIFGSDLEIIKIMAKKINFTLEMFYIKRDEDNNMVKKNFINYLLNGTLDACAGGLYNIYGNVVAYSGVYDRELVIWIYTVERETRSWQTLLRKTGGLYIFLIFLASYSIIWKLFCQFDGRAVSLNNTILYSFGALVGTTSLLDAMSLKQKILNLSYLILCLHLSSYISTQMYYYLTVENPPQTINTIDELAISDTIPYLVPTKKYFLNNDKYIAFANTSRDCEDFLDCERSVLKNRGATLILDGLLYPFQSSTAVKDESRIMRVDEDVLVLYHEMIMRKDSFMVDKLHNIILRLFEAGICDKLYKEAIGVTIVDKAKIAVKNILSYSYSCSAGCKITWLQLAGSFYLWMIGCGLSICCFIVEILTKKQV